MEKETCAARAKSYISNEELVGSLKQNVMVNQLTKAPLNVHSRWNLKRTSSNSSGICAADSSRYIVRDSKALIFQALSKTGLAGDSLLRLSCICTDFQSSSRHLHTQEYLEHVRYAPVHHVMLREESLSCSLRRVLSKESLQATRAMNLIEKNYITVII